MGLNGAFQLQIYQRVVEQFLCGGAAHCCWGSTNGTDLSKYHTFLSSVSLSLEAFRRRYLLNGQGDFLADLDNATVR